MDRPIDDIEIRNRRFGQWARVLFGALAVVIGILALRWIIAPSVAREDLRIARVERGPVVASISASGQVVPRDEQVISALFSSEVLAVAARAGDPVEAGDLLLRLDARSLETAVRALREQIALKDNQRRSAQLGLEKTLNEARGRKQLLEIDLESRKAREQRLAALVDKGAISTGELQEARLDVRRTEVELEQLVGSIHNTEASAEADLERIELESSILANQLSEQEHLLANAEVRAPRKGVVTFVMDQPGIAVTAGAPLARVADLTSYRVEAQVSDFYAQRLGTGLPAEVRAGDERLEATVEAVLPTVEGGAMTLRIELSDPDAPVLRPRLRVDVEVITGRAADALSLTNGPAVGEAGRHYVYRIVESEAIRTPVEFGFASRHRVQVVDGLTEGDEVIISDVRDYQHLDRFKVD